MTGEGEWSGSAVTPWSFFGANPWPTVDGVTPAFLLTCLVVVVAPGPGNVYTLSTGLARGIRAGVLAAAACTLGILPHLTLAITGVGAVLQATPVAFTVLRYAGCAYLVWMAWSMWRAPAPAVDDLGVPPRSRTAVLRDGIVLNLLNPKLTLFFLAFLPPFIPAGTDRPLLVMLALAAVFMAMTFVAFAVTAVFAGRLRGLLQRCPGIGVVTQRILALTLLAMAVRLALPG